jgi:D-methionine transport system permease protein
MFSAEMLELFKNGFGESLYMTVCATLFAYVLGLPWGILLAITDKDGICPNKAVYTVLDFVTNVLRSIPFLILLIWIQPLTRAIVGKSYGSSATMFPLFVAAAPFIARLVEGSLKEVDHGVVEAATSMGASTLQIIFKVLIVEARTSLIVGITIALGTILGYSAMAGTVGGGGLGDIAIRYGYYRREEAVMFVAVVLLVILIQVLQGIGMKIAKVVDKRISN